jgi:hypothetical protein
MLSQIKRSAVRAVIYYLVVFPLVVYLSKSGNFSGGPCNPGPGLVAYFLGFLSTIILVLVNTGLALVKGKKYLPVLLVHLAAIGVWLVLSFTL